MLTTIAKISTGFVVETIIFAKVCWVSKWM